MRDERRPIRLTSNINNFASEVELDPEVVKGAIGFGGLIAGRSLNKEQALQLAEKYFTESEVQIPGGSGDSGEKIKSLIRQTITQSFDLRIKQKKF